MSENKNKPESSTKADKATARHKALTIIGIILCVILVPILIVNCTLIVKSYVNEDEVPDFGGTMPFIVLTDSMYPDIKSGDIIICHTVDAADVEVGDVISFFDPAGKGTAIVTHKVIEKYESDGKLFFRTKGINNNTEDTLPVPAEKIVAEYTGIRIPGAGNIALFMQTVPGLIVCVVLPILLIVGYDFLRRRRYDKTKSDDVAALMAELEALKAAQAAEAAKSTAATAEEIPAETATAEETPAEEAPKEQIDQE